VNLFKSVCQLDICDFFGILKLEEAVATVPGHVDQNVGAGIGQQAF
jgi:hypothetical protein